MGSNILPCRRDRCAAAFGFIAGTVLGLWLQTHGKAWFLLFGAPRLWTSPSALLDLLGGIALCSAFFGALGAVVAVGVVRATFLLLHGKRR